MKEKLTREQLSKYSCPVSRGYFDHYSVLWRTTSFDGVYLWRHPNRTRYFEILMDVVGHVPQWSDITDRNLRLFVETITENLCANSARSICAELKAIINEFHGEENIPSQKYAKILTVRRKRLRCADVTFFNCVRKRLMVQLLERCGILQLNLLPLHKSIH